MDVDYRFVWHGIDDDFTEEYVRIYGAEGDTLDEWEDYLEYDFWLENHLLMIDGCWACKFWTGDNVVFGRFHGDYDEERSEIEGLVRAWITEDPTWARLGANAGPFVTGEEIKEEPTNKYVICERAGYVTNIWVRDADKEESEHDDHIESLPCGCGSDEDNPCVCN